MRIGFIGTGVITSAIVTGLCTSNFPVEAIWISPRNREKSKNLEQKFDPVNIGDSNQEVLENSDVVVLGILPGHKNKILEPLEFQSSQVIVHLLAGVSTREVLPLVAPAKNVVKVLPLPCVAIHAGPVAMFPENKIVYQIFESLGSVVLADSEDQLEVFTVITALMAPYYAMLKTISTWAVNEGVSRKNASEYTAAMFGALSLITQNLKNGEVAGLITESMTPGGLNELAMKVLEYHGGFENIQMALKKVKKRVNLNTG